MFGFLGISDFDRLLLVCQKLPEKHVLPGFEWFVGNHDINIERSLAKWWYVCCYCCQHWPNMYVVAFLQTGVDSEPNIGQCMPQRKKKLESRSLDFIK